MSTSSIVSTDDSGYPTEKYSDASTTSSTTTTASKSYCTPFVTVVSIQEPSLLSPAKSKSKQNSSTDEEGLQTCGKMVASSSSSSKHLVRRTSSPPATTNQKEPGYVTVLEIGSSNNNNNNNKAEVKRPTHHSVIPSKPTRSPSFQKNTTVTVQIKTNKNSSVKRSASANSSDHIKPPQAIIREKSVQTLPHRSRSSSETSANQSHQHKNTNVSSAEEDLVIYRLPGEKLGLGLRFEGGSKAHELVHRLFVQCCSKGSPAARTRCTWGSLSDGDEIISISGKLVRRMTRVDCVKALKESPVSVKMRIRHYFSVNSSASYDVRQGFELIEDYDQRRCQTLERSAPRKPTRSSINSSSKSATTPRSSSVPALLHQSHGPPNGFSDKTKSNVPMAMKVRSGTAQRTSAASRSTSAEISPNSSVTGTTRAIIERTRSARINSNTGEKAATLPRKSSTTGMFVKAGKSRNSKARTEPESFVDLEDEKERTQTLPRSYKTGGQNNQKILLLQQQKKLQKHQQNSLNRTQSANGVNLVLSSNSFVSSTMPNGQQHHQDANAAVSTTKPIQKPIRPVLTVQEKLAQEMPSLPPQAEVYVNLLDGESVEDDDSLLNIENSVSSAKPTKNEKILEDVNLKISQNRESDESSSVSTLSTIQSKLTPRSSFSTYDYRSQTSMNNFDLAKLLDPFEQLEREFNWDDVTIRPPSAFSSMVDVNENNQENNETEAGNSKRCNMQQNIENSLRDMEVGSYQTLDRRSRKDLFRNKAEAAIRNQERINKNTSLSQGSDQARQRRSASSSAALFNSSSKQTIMMQTTTANTESSMAGFLSSASTAAASRGHHHHTFAEEANEPPPPTLSRLPPDGHEFPPDYRDPAASTISYQNSEILSRKSSASSTGSLDRNSDGGRGSKVKRLISGQQSNNQIASSVKAKIAMFSCSSSVSGGGTKCSETSKSTSSLTRSLTHNDVRYEENSQVKNNVPKTIAAYRSMVNVNEKSSANSHSASNLINKVSTFGNGRSQSLMEIGKKTETVKNPNSRSFSSNGLLLDHRDRNNDRMSNKTKLKGLVIPESSNESPVSSSASSATKVLTTPPWKSSSDNFPKYSPAFKRKPFVVYSDNLETSGKKVSATLQPVKSDDSDNDSAVSSGRSSLSHSSVSPPNSPKGKQKQDTIKEMSSSSTGVESESSSPTSSVQRVLKKDSIEAINRRNILESCKKSNAKQEFNSKCWPGKPASRSSSFTIAERKKSFEMMTGSKSETCQNMTSKMTSHSSQDSLSSSSRKASREYDSAFTSRRPSKDIENGDFNSSSLSRRSSRGSESLAETIKDIETRVAQMSENVLRSGNPNSSAETMFPNKVVDNDKWSTLERKYGNPEHSGGKKSEESSRPKDLVFGPNTSRKSSLSSDRSSSKTSPGGSGSKSIRELAERWESRSSLMSPDKNLDFITTGVGGGKMMVDAEDCIKLMNNAAEAVYFPAESSEWESYESNPSIPVDRKYSVPIYGSDVPDAHHGSGSVVKMRDNKKNNTAPSRPSSLIETGAGTELKVFEIGHLGDLDRNRVISASTSRGSSQADLLDCSTTSDTPKSPLPGCSSSRELLEVFGGRTPMSENQISNGAGSASGSSGRRCVSVNDIRRAFEKAEQSLQAAAKGLPEMSPCHNRMSSLDSTNSDESSIPTPHYPLYGSVSSLISGHTENNMRNHYGSISSIASSTSRISDEELQALIDEANQSLEESGTPSHEIMVIVLHREFAAGSVGITLAGGADYESKEITVHKVIPGTLADRDGRIQKGDRVLSINGKSTKGVTHREALSILKAPRPDNTVVMVLSRSRSVTPHGEGSYDRTDYPSYNYLNSGRPPKILESPLDSKSLLSDLKFVDVPRGSPKTVVLKKEGTGLGFSLEGGKDSPLGDRPLTIKKIFTGGAADKTGVLKVGDEILTVNNTDCSKMSRIEAWNFMKKLNDGTATLVVRQKIENVPSQQTATTATTTVSKSNGNQEQMTSVEQKEPEKLEAKR